jgi:hypothetical protein
MTMEESNEELHKQFLFPREHRTISQAQCNANARTNTSQKAPKANLLVDEGGGHAGFSAAPGAANAVHVVLDFGGHVEVNHVLNVGKIETFGGNVRGHLFQG